MKRTCSLLLALILFAASVTPSFACVFNGRNYPPGSVVGDRVCQADGSWRPAR